MGKIVDASEVLTEFVSCVHCWIVVIRFFITDNIVLQGLYGSIAVSFK
jgi:hypothetical protein